MKLLTILGCLQEAINASIVQDLLKYASKQFEKQDEFNPELQNCLIWFDGCNTCAVKFGIIGFCSNTKCDRKH